MSTSTKLEELTLCFRGCKVGAGALEIAAALRQLPRLHCLELNFGHSSVDAKGSVALALAVSTRTKLEELTLFFGFCEVGAGALDVAAALRRLPRLRRLHFNLRTAASTPRARWRWRRRCQRAPSSWS